MGKRTLSFLSLSTVQAYLESEKHPEYSSIQSLSKLYLCRVGGKTTHPGERTEVFISTALVAFWSDILCFLGEGVSPDTPSKPQTLTHVLRACSCFPPWLVSSAGSAEKGQAVLPGLTQAAWPGEGLLFVGPALSSASSWGKLLSPLGEGHSLVSQSEAGLCWTPLRHHVTEILKAERWEKMHQVGVREGRETIVGIRHKALLGRKHAFV